MIYKPDVREKIAHNLAEDYMTIESIAGATHKIIAVATKSAFSEMDPKGGWVLALERVLDALKQGNIKFSLLPIAYHTRTS